MAKWNPPCGQSGHIHVSLKSKAGKPVFPTQCPLFMSTRMPHFVAGQQALMRNSWGWWRAPQLVPAWCGFWAPTHATWGAENRTCACVRSGLGNSQRVDTGLPPPTAILPGLAGCTRLRTVGDRDKLALAKRSAATPTIRSRPPRARCRRRCGMRRRVVRASKAARACFGDAFVEHSPPPASGGTQFRKSVTDWRAGALF